MLKLYTIIYLLGKIYTGVLKKIKIKIRKILKIKIKQNVPKIKQNAWENK